MTVDGLDFIVSPKERTPCLLSRLILHKPKRIFKTLMYQDHRSIGAGHQSLRNWIVLVPMLWITIQRLGEREARRIPLRMVNWSVCF